MRIDSFILCALTIALGIDHLSSSPYPLFFSRLHSYFVPKAFLPVILTLASAVQRQLCVKGPGGVVKTPLCQDPVYTVTQVMFLWCHDYDDEVECDDVQDNVIPMDTQNLFSNKSRVSARCSYRTGLLTSFSCYDSRRPSRMTSTSSRKVKLGLKDKEEILPVAHAKLTANVFVQDVFLHREWLACIESCITRVVSPQDPDQIKVITESTVVNYHSEYGWKYALICVFCRGTGYI
jgi:hypothetical protein